MYKLKKEEIRDIGLNFVFSQMKILTPMGRNRIKNLEIFGKDNKEKLLGTVIEVKAQQVINQETKSLRHTNFLRFRPEKNPSECTWDTVS